MRHQRWDNNRGQILDHCCCYARLGSCVYYGSLCCYLSYGKMNYFSGFITEKLSTRGAVDMTMRLNEIKRKFLVCKRKIVEKEERERQQ